MKQEDKELLLKDLSARLPYQPKIKIIYQQQGIKGTDEGNVSCDVIEHIVNDLRNGVITDMQIYLRPMSSMMEEEKEEFEQIRYNAEAKLFNALSKGGFTLAFHEIDDWLNAHHFDYRNLIEKDLAIAVDENNNPYDI